MLEALGSRRNQAGSSLTELIGGVEALRNMAGNGGGLAERSFGSLYRRRSSICRDAVNFRRGRSPREPAPGGSYSNVKEEPA